MPFINDKLEYFARQQRLRGEGITTLEEINKNEPVEAEKRPLQTRFRFDVEEVMEHLRARIFGQEQAMRAIEKMLKIVKADLSDPERPLYVGLFLGPTGVGKTEIVRILAEAIHGSREAFCRVDMNTLAMDHYAAALTGAPPGYVGSKEGSTIFDKEKIEGSYSKPGIVLFDEIEKASPQVIQTLLNIFDNGRLTIASGEETIDFRNTIILMTSNIGAREIYHYAENRFSFFLKQLFYHLNPRFAGRRKTESTLEWIIRKNVERTFKPEFINRIDDIITFNWLKQEVLDDIIEKLLADLNKRISKYRCCLELQSDAKALIIEKGFDKRYGGRALKRTFRHLVYVPLAEKLLESSSTEQSVTFIAHRDGDGIQILDLDKDEQL